MKNWLGSFAVLVVFISMLSFSSAALTNSACNPEITLLNQDPYPAQQGDYVDLVFKIDNIDSNVCDKIYVELVEEYPISFDKDAKKTYDFNSGYYTQDFDSYVLAPFKVRIDQSAFDKNYEVKIKYSNYESTKPSFFLFKEFNITIEERKSDFELSIRDFDNSTQTITFDIINIGKNDVTALTVDMKRQPAFDLKGSSRSIVGKLDAADDTSFTFEGVPMDGDIMLTIKYNDELGNRYSREVSVYYDPSLFVGRIRDVKKPSYVVPVILVILVLIIIYVVVKKILKKRKLAKLQSRAK